MANPENKQIPYESTQKDIRDAIESVATAIGGITHPDAEDIVYDNSVSGLSATDVQNALDEIVSDIPTVNNGTLTIQQNGTSKGSFTANSVSNVNVNIETPTADKKTATDQFTTADGGLLSKCQINLVPVQSGSGDPYPAGGGKNKFDGSQVSQSSSYNWDVLWSNENLTVEHKTTYSGGIPTSATMSLASGIYVLSYTATTDVNLDLYINGAFNKVIRSGDTFTISNGDTCYFTFPNSSATTITYSNIQVELGSTATAYAPYSNICPITGHTQVEVENAGKNLFDKDSATEIGYLYANGLIEHRTGWRISDYIPVSKNSVYTMSGNRGDNPSYCLYDVNKQYISGAKFGNVMPLQISTSNATYIRISVATDTLETTMLEFGTEATPYVPYNGYQITVNLGGTYYGGYDEIVSGKGKSTYAVADFGDLTWYYDSANTRFRGEMPSNYKQPTSASDRYQYLYCSCYKPDDSPVTGSHVNNTIGGFQGTTYIFVNDSAYTDAGQFKTARTGQKIAYLLSTPTDITTAPQQIETLAGQNNLSTPLDGQSIETNGVEYKELFTFADVKEYVDKKIPDAPTTDGTYTLQAVVSGGVPTYSWV